MEKSDCSPLRYAVAEPGCLDHEKVLLLNFGAQNTFR